MVGAIKQSEESEEVYIVRLHEDRGQQCKVKVTFNFGESSVKSVKVVNSLEEELDIMEASQILHSFDDQSVSLHMRPYKIVSLALHLS